MDGVLKFDVIGTNAMAGYKLLAEGPLEHLQKAMRDTSKLKRGSSFLGYLSGQKAPRVSQLALHDYIEQEYVRDGDEGMVEEKN